MLGLLKKKRKKSIWLRLDNCEGNSKLMVDTLPPAFDRANSISIAPLVLKLSGIRADSLWRISLRTSLKLFVLQLYFLQSSNTNPSLRELQLLKTPKEYSYSIPFSSWTVGSFWSTVNNLFSSLFFITSIYFFFYSSDFYFGSEY